MSRMSMLTRGVLCLLVVVFYCAGVSVASTADAGSAKSLAQATEEMIKWGKATNKSVEEALAAKAKCNESANAVKEIGREVKTFAQEILNNTQSDLQNGQEKRIKAEEYLIKARSATQSARDALNKWGEAANASTANAHEAREALKAFHKVSMPLLNNPSASGDGVNSTEKVMAAMEEADTVGTALTNALLVARDARETIPAAEKEVTAAEETLKLVEESIGDVKRVLPDLPAAAKAILNNTALMEKIKEKNGSSNPAVLRVPLLLLLLLPVLGCMAVC